jgi:hypothetical protein
MPEIEGFHVYKHIYVENNLAGLIRVRSQDNLKADECVRDGAKDRLVARI